MHGEFLDLMMRSLDGELNAREQSALQTHLRSCEPCAHEWAALSRVQQVLAEGPAFSPADGFAARVRERIEAQPARNPGSVTTRVALTVATACVALIAALLGAFSLSDIATPESLATGIGTMLAIWAGASAWLDIGATFARVAGQIAGDGPLLVATAFVVILTLIWARLVTRYVPSHCPSLANGG